MTAATGSDQAAAREFITALVGRQPGILFEDAGRAASRRDPQAHYAIFGMVREGKLALDRENRLHAVPGRERGRSR
jgi:hypothetical protein